MLARRASPYRRRRTDALRSPCPWRSPPRLPRLDPGARSRWWTSPGWSPVSMCPADDNQTCRLVRVFDPGTRAAQIHAELDRLTAAGAVTVADSKPSRRTARASSPTTSCPSSSRRGRRSTPTARSRPTEVGPTWTRSSRSSPAGAARWTRIAIEDESGAAFELLMTQGPNPSSSSRCSWPTVRGPEATPSSRTASRALCSARWTRLPHGLVARFSTSDPSAYTWADAHCTRVDPSGPVEALGLGCVPTDDGNGTVPRARGSTTISPTGRFASIAPSPSAARRSKRTRRRRSPSSRDARLARTAQRPICSFIAPMNVESSCALRASSSASASAPAR